MCRGLRVLALGMQWNAGECVCVPWGGLGSRVCGLPAAQCGSAYNRAVSSELGHLVRALATHGFAQHSMHRLIQPVYDV